MRCPLRVVKSYPKAGLAAAPGYPIPAANLPRNPMSPRRKKGTPPPYREHATGQGFAVYRGEHFYFGKFGTPKSLKRYREFLAALAESEAAPVVAESGCTVAEVVAAAMTEARRRFAAEGQPTSTLRKARSALGRLLERYGPLPAAEFKRRDLLALRRSWEQDGLSRATVATYTGLVRQAFAWAADAEAVPEDVPAALARVLTAAGRETDPVPAVAEKVFRRTLPHLSPQLRRVVQWQYWTGCRPGEACRCRRGELSAEGVATLPRGRQVQVPGGVWVWQPKRHKVRKRKPFLAYLVGPQAQRVVAPLPNDPDAWLFPSGLGKPYREESYCRAVVEACEAHGIPRWTPNQLRHASVTRYDREAGIEMASKVHGHAGIATSEIYLERDLRETAELVARLG